MKVHAVFVVTDEKSQKTKFSIANFADAYAEASRVGGKVVLCANDRFVPCSVAVYLNIVKDEDIACSIIKYDGVDDCLSGLLTALQFAPFWYISDSMPSTVTRALFEEIYHFEVPEELDSNSKVVTRILNRINAIQSSVSSDVKNISVAFTVDSVRAMLYAKDQEDLCAQIRDVYKFHGSLAHLKDVPPNMLEELYFMVTHRSATEGDRSTMLQQIVLHTGCTSDNTSKDPEISQFAEQLRAVRVALRNTPDGFAEVAGLPMEDYFLLERGDLAPTITDVTAILCAIVRCVDA